MRKGIIGLSLLLTISLIPAYSATPPKAGSACSKQGITKSYQGKKFTCIKSGKNLVWSKGVSIKSASPSLKPLPSPKPRVSTNSTSSSDEISRDPRISSISLLSPAEVCKTVDATPDSTQSGIFHRNGFPRPANAFYPSGKAKILIIPFNYRDYPFLTKLPANTNRTTTDLEAIKKVNGELEELAKSLSAGKLELEISILPEREWLTFDPDLIFNNTPFTNNFPVLLEMLKRNDGKIDFEKYDSYVFVGTALATGFSIGQAAFSTELRTSKGQANKVVLMYQSWENPYLFLHELAHAMFGLEDLYLFTQIFGEVETDWLPSELTPILGWDLMASPSASNFSNWNRLLMGWISDSEVRCLTDRSQSTHYLSDFTSSDQPKLLLINLAPGVTLAAESRPWGESHRLLLYVIDTNLRHGEGPIRALNTLVQAGQTKELFDWKFNVLKSSKDGLLLEVSKGSGKKYVVPKRQQTSQGGGGGDRPQPRIGEALPTTYLNARIRWEVSNYKSYRIFITPFDDPKKILFDTGIVNDSRDPLIVEASGLICGKELMTTSQFWTERDGKGVKEQSSSGQIGKFECK